MIAARKQIAALTALVATSVTLLTSVGVNAAMSPGVVNYVPIEVQDIKKEAEIVLENARIAGRLQPRQVETFSADLRAATSLPEVEQAWAHIEAGAQLAKDKHPSLDNLIAQFQTHLNSLQQQLIVPSQGWKFYSDRLAGIERIKKELTVQKDHMWIFWDYVALAIDLSSVQERLTRALSENHPDLETLNELILRTDNYLARNDVAARMLSTYKSFEVEPDDLQNSKYAFYQVLRDKAHSHITTPEVKAQLFARLKAIHYEAAKTLPSEAEIDGAIAEVQRLVDAGARNGHLTALDDVRIEHELQLVKKLKIAYPGQDTGIDPIKKELRMEEVRFMSLDLRFLQDWLGRILRKDGEVQEAREQILRSVRRADLAYFSHRIAKEDVLSLLGEINTALQDSHNDRELSAACRAIEAKMDMMISDFSMVPAKTALRYNAITAEVSGLRIDRDQVGHDLQHAGTLVEEINRTPEGPLKYGQSVVAATELELIRSRVAPLLQAQ